MRWDQIDWSCVDWDRALYVGRQERLLPLWYATLRERRSLHHAPPAVRDALQHAYYGALAANALAMEEAVRLHTDLAAHGVQAVALKGVALLATIYRDLGIRPMGDIDLWVQPADCARTEAVLRAAGYHGLAHQAVRGPQRFLSERTFLRSAPPQIQLDLHTAPWVRQALAPPWLCTWMWAHTKVATYGDDSLRVLDATAQFVHLCLHATQQDEGRLAPLRLYDLALVMADAELDWRDVATIGQAAQVTPAFERAIQATASAWGSEVPADARWPPATRRAQLRCALLAADAPPVRWLVDGCALKNVQDALTLWWSVLWPAREYRAWRNAIGAQRRTNSLQIWGGKHHWHGAEEVSVHKSVVHRAGDV